MAKQPNNPAGRLLRIVEALKKLDRNKAADEAWAVILGVDPSDNGALMAKIGAALQLGREIEEGVRKCEVNQDLYVGHVHAILKAFRKMKLGAAIAGICDAIKAENIEGLRFCDDLLSRRQPEKIIARTHLEEIHKEIIALTDHIIASEIDEMLRYYLLDKLDMLRQAVEMYDIAGVKKIEIAVNDILGSAYISGRLRTMPDKAETNRFVKIVVGLFVLIGAFNDAVQLPESIQKVLPGAQEVVCELVDKQHAGAPEKEGQPMVGKDAEARGL